MIVKAVGGARRRPAANVYAQNPGGTQRQIRPGTGRRARPAAAFALAAAVGLAGLWFGAAPAYGTDGADHGTDGKGHGIVRFHVVAHSDDAVDQGVKLPVRDRVLQEMTVIASHHGGWDRTPWDAYLDKLAAAAREELAKAGLPYGARATWGKEPLSDGHRAELDLPGTEHATLRIVLGDGRGRNWWCVLFPPLCFVDASQGLFTLRGGTRGETDGREPEFAPELGSLERALASDVGSVREAPAGEEAGAEEEGTPAERARWKIRWRMLAFLHARDKGDELASSQRPEGQ